MSEILAQIGSLDTTVSTLVGSLGVYGSWTIFGVVFLFGETAIFILLLLSQQNILSLEEVCIFATLGTLCADIFWFIVGRYFPQQIIPTSFKKVILYPVHSFLKSVSKDRIFLSIFFLKFLIGARLAIILHFARESITFTRFLIYDALGTVMYVLLLAALGVGFGHLINTALTSYHVVTSFTIGFLVIFFISRMMRNIYIKHSAK